MAKGYTREDVITAYRAQILNHRALAERTIPHNLIAADCGRIIDPQPRIDEFERGQELLAEAELVMSEKVPVGVPAPQIEADGETIIVDAFYRAGSLPTNEVARRIGLKRR